MVLDFSAFDHGELLSFPRSANQFQCPNYSAGSRFSRLDATLRMSGKTTLLKPFPKKWSLKQMPSEKSERKWDEGKRPRGGGAGWERGGSGLIEWGQKSKPPKVPGTKINPKQIPCRVSEPKKFPESVKWYNTTFLHLVVIPVTTLETPKHRLIKFSLREHLVFSALLHLSSI